jgi:hypothetical protein
MARTWLNFHWPLDQFLRDRRSGPPKTWRRWALRDWAEFRAPTLPETNHGASGALRRSTVPGQLKRVPIGVESTMLWSTCSQKWSGARSWRASGARTRLQRKLSELSSARTVFGFGCTRRIFRVNPTSLFPSAAQRFSSMGVSGMAMQVASAAHCLLRERCSGDQKSWETSGGIGETTRPCKDWVGMSSRCGNVS